ncbi:H-NS family histone-like protein [Candidatus Enterovibrio altilux]|uniref:DNA-binding protein n=1 Tax=Candidatus Enterovibrio altilux TaxID=1927128 RepID=A0A291BB09_9GAMM|nr:H-NS family nucleoid-associated regulatory protein [Candidatus Enterovibrio luxaltus]ATF10183.1 DNA-binding protein H-NS [Candidatus Enterovibrio luxaltus]
MSDVLKVLLNLRSLRATARELTLEQLQEALKKLQAVVIEREETEAEAYVAKKEHLDKIEQYREMLIKDGIDPEELLETLSGTKLKSKRASRPAKYKYIDIDGLEKTWTGQGRTPKAIKDSVNAGAKIENYLL